MWLILVDWAFLFVYVVCSPQLCTRKLGGGGHHMYFSCKNVIVTHSVILLNVDSEVLLKEAVVLDCN